MPLLPTPPPERTPRRPPSIQLVGDILPVQISTSPSPTSPAPAVPASPAYYPPTSPHYPSTPPHKYSRSVSFPALPRRRLPAEPFWLLLYFLFNLALTLYNKLVLVRFPFPYTLTALHAFAGTLGSYIAMELHYFTPVRLSPRESALLAAFSLLYTINIAVSNISLSLVTVPFHQVVRAATPLFVILLSPLLLPRPLSRLSLLALLPVTLGVALATYGDYYFTLPGLLLTLLGTVLAALKTIATNALQSSPHAPTKPPLLPRILPALLTRPLKLHPLDLLLRMSPLAFIQCVLYAHTSGELARVRAFGALEMSPSRAAALAVNAAMAFGLNVVSFTANSKVGPLSITVAANIKQVLTILLSVTLFNLTITPLNAAGIALTLLGGAAYAAVEWRQRGRRRAGLR
ncbi:triose-phosphate transporter family-domain-containing protein [Gautieria morchelliformis]|nr:triose-phosphate transporter family-domain-containing protein [Gautieria morchelliformis]